MTAVSSPNANVFPTPAATTPATTPTAGSATAGGSNGNNVGVITNQSSLNETESQFLTLLTTQLQNQDPTSPMDTSQFTSELVSMSQVEQQLNTNQDLSQLVSLGQNNQSQLGLSYMGLDVDVQGNQFSFNPSTDASVTVGYNLASAAASNTINVLDSSGNVVYTTQGSLNSGTNNFTWNGTETNGSAAPAGTYTVQVNAASATNTPVSATTNVPGQVTGMQTASDGTVELIVNGQAVPLSSVTSATLPQTTSN
jgi:flagellar basal-body rod modification protein FlgD